MFVVAERRVRHDLDPDMGLTGQSEILSTNTPNHRSDITCTSRIIGRLYFYLGRTCRTASESCGVLRRRFLNDELYSHSDWGCRTSFVVMCDPSSFHEWRKISHGPKKTVPMVHTSDNGLVCISIRAGLAELVSESYAFLRHRFLAGERRIGRGIISIGLTTQQASAP